MASDEEDDLEALRQAALATLRKKSAVVEDVQPIPQLTSSGHSLQGSNSSPWADDFVPDSVPFPDNPPVTQFQNSAWGQQFQQPPYGSRSPTHFNANSWRGGRGSYHKPFHRGRGVFPAHNARPPFGAAQPVRLPFNQNQNAFAPGVPPALRGSNLIVINTVPENERQPVQPGFQGSRFPVGARGRGAPGGLGAGRGAPLGGQNNSAGPVPVESASKPMLLRPQDKYCPDGNSDNSQDASSLHRKRKDKFSRFESSGSESDDESSDSDEDGVDPAKSASVSLHDDSIVSKNDGDEDVDRDASRAVADTELSISVMNSSGVNSDLDEPASNVELGDSAKTSDAEVSQEVEDRLLASPSPVEVSEQLSDHEESVDSRSRSVAASIEETKPNSGSPQAQSIASGESQTDSSSNSGQKSGNESDSESSTSSDSSDAENATSGGDTDSESEAEGKSDNSQSDDNSEGSQSPSASQHSADSGSNSDGEDKRTAVRRSPAKDRVPVVNTKSGSFDQSQTKVKPTPTLTPEEQAKLEARKRKFEGGQEVTVVDQGKKISLKGIIPKSKKPKQPAKTTTVPVKTANSSHASSVSKPQVTKTVSDTHRKNTRRKVSIEDPAKSDNDSGTENVGDVEEDSEDDEEEGGRSWKREANRNVKQRAAVHVDQALPRPGPFRGNTQRGFNRNGGYRKGYDQHRDRYQQWQRAPRDSRPEVHYSSSDDSEDNRKLISVVVPRSAAGQQSQNKVVSRLGVVTADGSHGRKRHVAENSPGVPVDEDDDSRGGGFVSKTKRMQLESESQEGSGAISVVISGNTSKRPRSTASRLSVHQRLGMPKGPETSRSQSRTNIRPVSHVQEEPEGVPKSRELDQRIRRIKEKNAAILRRQEEVRQDRELYG